MNIITDPDELKPLILKELEGGSLTSFGLYLRLQLDRCYVLQLALDMLIEEKKIRESDIDYYSLIPSPASATDTPEYSTP